MNKLSTPPTPWYKSPYVWLLISIPLASVISTTVLITLANIHKDGLVVDDYYKRGKAINQILFRDRNAVNAGIRAELQFQDNKQVLVKLFSNKEITTQNLELKLIHVRYPHYDQLITLKPASSLTFTGQIKTFPASKWYIQIGNKQWRLLARKSINSNSNIVLGLSQ